MPPRSRVTFPPLDVAATRAAVAAGRSVRVGIVPMGQFPEGTAGRVRAVGDPDIDGAEFIQVEVSVGGARDVIPFAPADLSPIRRTQTAPEPVSATKRIRAPRGATRTSSPAKPAPSARPVPEAPTLPSIPEPGIAGPGISEPEPVAVPDPAVESGASGKPSPSGRTRSQVAPGDRRAQRPRRPALTITISTTGPENSDWQLEVRQGTRSLIKAVPVRPARAWELVGALGHSELNTVVAQALSEQRQQVQERADRLAHELEAARADLEDFPLF